MNYEELLSGIRSLNLNKKYTNPNHDQKLVNFFYKLNLKDGLNMSSVPIVCQTLKDEGYSEEMTNNIDQIAYIINLIQK